MYHVTLEYAKKNFEEVMERAGVEPGGVTIVQDNKSFVLIDREELEAWTETVELLKDPNLLSDIESARKEYEEGETFTMNEVFSES